MDARYKPDKKNSSFYHRIYFKTDLPSKRGWSKAMGFTEPKDKVICLQNVIVRLRTGAYTPEGGYNSQGEWVDPTESISFFDNQNNELICTIAEDQFEMHFHNFPHTRFWRWLEYFCAECRAGKSINHLIKVHLNFRYDKLFSVEEPRFLNKTMLSTWCKQKINEGHDKQVVETMEKEYCKKWFANQNSINLEELGNQYNFKTRRI